MRSAVVDCVPSDPRFYSYRRDKTTGRMGSLIWLK
jgi:copper oxidase (laccase) domain-containing protein